MWPRSFELDKNISVLERLFDIVDWMVSSSMRLDNPFDGLSTLYPCSNLTLLLIALSTLIYDYFPLTGVLFNPLGLFLLYFWYFYSLLKLFWYLETFPIFPLLLVLLCLFGLIDVFAPLGDVFAYLYTLYSHSVLVLFPLSNLT